MCVLLRCDAVSKGGDGAAAWSGTVQCECRPAQNNWPGVGSPLES